MRLINRFGSLPIKESELGPKYDKNANPIEGAYCQYNSYENTKSKVELSFYTYTSKDNMDVQLYIVTK